jgi:putative transposase
MPRRRRAAVGGLVYHVLNRANARRQIFFNPFDYAAFEKVLAEAVARTPLELFAYCLMPNHFHLVVRPAEDGDLWEFMRWLTVTHTQRWHANHQTSGTGHLYQGRFKSFPIEVDHYFLAACRYVEGNALRGGLIPSVPGSLPRAEDWGWSSLWRRVHGDGGRGSAIAPPLTAWPVEEPMDWLALVNRPQSREEEEALRLSIVKGRPFGSEEYQAWTSEILGLSGTFREPGRPKVRAKDRDRRK